MNLPRRITGNAAPCVVVLLLLAALAGCHHGVEPYPGERDPLAYPNLAVEGGLGDALLFADAIVSAEAGKPMQVIQPIRSRADEAQHVQYRFEFFDIAGRPLPALGWQFLTLAPGTQYFLKGGALELTAVKWRLTVRLAE